MYLVNFTRRRQNYLSTRIAEKSYNSAHFHLRTHTLVSSQTQVIKHFRFLYFEKADIVIAVPHWSNFTMDLENRLSGHWPDPLFLWNLSCLNLIKELYISFTSNIKHNESFPKSSKVDIIRLEMWSDHFPPDILRRRRIHKRLNLLTKYRDLGKKHFQLDFLVKGKHINVIYITSWYWSTIILYINNYIWWYDLKKQKK